MPSIAEKASQGYADIADFMAMLQRDDVKAAHPATQCLARSGLSKGHFFEVRKSDGTNIRVDTLQRLCKAYGARLVVLIP